MSVDNDVNKQINSEQKQLLLARGQMDLKHLINDQSKILQQDADKIVCLCYNANNEPIIIKVVNSQYTEHSGFDELINEAFTADFGINGSKYANYARVLGYQFDETCPALIKHPLCDYIAYEYIPGVSLYEYIITKQGDRQTLISIIRQIFRALYQGFKDLNFVHYDLHLRNIIIKPDNTPVFIDYGRTHIKYANKDYGMESEPAYVRNKGIWQIDIIYVLSRLINFLCPDTVLRKYTGKFADSTLSILELGSSISDFNYRIDDAYVYPEGKTLDLFRMKLELNAKLTNQINQIRLIEGKVIIPNINIIHYGSFDWLIDLLNWLVRPNSKYVQEICYETLFNRFAVRDTKINLAFNSTIEEFDKFLELFENISH